MPQNVKQLLDELLTVDDLMTVALTAVAANVDLSNHSGIAQVVSTSLAALSLVGTIVNKIKNGRVS